MGLNKGPLENARQHLKEQLKTWQKTLGIEQHAEAEKLLNEQIFDNENSGFIPSEHISYTLKNLQEIKNVEERMIYVLKLSNAFTVTEIASGLKPRTRKTVTSIFTRLKSHISN